MATPFDAAAKDLIEMAPADWLGFLGHPRSPELVRVIDADLSATVSTSTDKVIRVDDPEPWLLMIELQAAWDGDLPFDLLRRYALLRHRHRLPVSCAIVLLRPEANTSTMSGTFGQPDRLGRDWDFPFHVVRVWELPVETIIRGPAGLWPLAPVAGVDRTDILPVLLQVRERVFGELSRSRAETLWEATLQLLALRYDDESIEQWENIMAAIDISTTKLGTRLLSQGRVEGRVEEARENVVTLGSERFGPPPTEIAQALHATTDLAHLHHLVKRVLHASTWQELLAE
jgi:hypothetical protein